MAGEPVCDGAAVALAVEFAVVVAVALAVDVAVVVEVAVPVEVAVAVDVAVVVEVAVAVKVAVESPVTAMAVKVAGAIDVAVLVEVPVGISAIALISLMWVSNRCPAAAYTMPRRINTEMIHLMSLLVIICPESYFQRSSFSTPWRIQYDILENMRTH